MTGQFVVDHLIYGQLHQSIHRWVWKYWQESRHYHPPPPLTREKVCSLNNSSSAAENSKTSQYSNSIQPRTAPWCCFPWFNPRYGSLARSTPSGEHLKDMSHLFLTHFQQFRQFVSNGYWWNHVLENDERRPCWETNTCVEWCRRCVVWLQSPLIQEKSVPIIQLELISR